MNRPRSNPLLLAVLLIVSLLPDPASAAQTIVIGGDPCRNDRLFAHDFGEETDLEVGLLTRTLAGRTHFLVVPPGYRHASAHPLLLALHGTGGSPAGAVSNALAIARIWQPIARDSGMLVVVPIGSSPMGSWNPPVDFDYLDELRAHVAGEFNIDVRRHYLWGFSAGGHVGHDLVLQRTDQFAAYAIAAGVLRGYACAPADCPAYLAAVIRKVPLDVSSGTIDPTVLFSEVVADEGRFTDAGWQSGLNLWVRGLSGQRHTYTAGQLSANWNTICRFGVVPGG